MGVTPRDARVCARVCPGDVKARKTSCGVFLVKTGMSLFLLVLATIEMSVMALLCRYSPGHSLAVPFLDGGMGVGNSVGVSISPSRTSVVGREERDC